MNNRATNQKEDVNQLSRKLSPLTKMSNQSRPFSRVKSVTGQRKKPWNRRFIYNKIPDYYSIKDKNVINAKKIRMNSVKKKNVFDINYITYQQSKLYQSKKNPIKPFNRTMSGFFSHYSRGINNDFSTNRNIISPLTNSAFNRNNLMKNSNINLNINININDENFNKIKKLWNELCVSSSYRELFIIIYNQLTGEEKEQLFKREFSELISIKTDIKTLNFYIEQRNIVLKDLYEENTKLNRNKSDKNDQVLIEISNLIEKLRESTVDVCLAMKKLKNGINNVNNLAKYNLDLIASKSKFDKNYLIKMKGELSFLKEGNAKLYFNLSDDRSPFLLKTSEANINMINNTNLNSINDKDFFIRIVPLKEETKELISECNYYIYQELIAYQQNIIAQKKMFRCVSPIKSIPYIDNKENDNSGNNIKNINDSTLYRKVSKNMFNEFSDINSVMTMNTNNIFGDKKFKNVQNLINQRFSAPPTKDLFSQKLFSGYILGDIPNNNFLAEDEKVKDEEEEEEEEEKERTENDTTRNELNDLIEEKKSETENNENNIDNNSGEDKKKEDIKDIEEVSNSNKNGSDSPSGKNSDNKDNHKDHMNDENNQYLNDGSNEYVNIHKEDDSNNNNKELNSNREKNNLINSDIHQSDRNDDKKNTEKTNSKEDDNKKKDKDENKNNNLDENKINETEKNNNNNVNTIDENKNNEMEENNNNNANDDKNKEEDNNNKEKNNNDNKVKGNEDLLGLIDK